MKNYLPLFFLLVGSFVFGQIVPKEATVLGHWEDNTILPTSFYNNRYNETWGFEQKGVEYAVIGSTQGIHIFNLETNTLGKQHFIQGASSGDFLIHRDFKDHKGYLYAVADEYNSSKLQIINLNTLPDTAAQVYISNEFVTTAHNLFIDTSQNKLYLIGASGNTKILDITDPIKPVLLASYPNATLNLPYVHDAYIRDNIGFMNCGTNQGLWIVDFTNPLAPVLLSKFQTYTGKGYNHSGWLSKDKKTYYLLDETHGSPIKAVDVSNLEDPKEIATFNAGSTSNQIPHNALLRGDYIYVSYYYDGVQVFNIANPANPFRVAYYPTSTIVNNSSYAGNWGVFPFARSGRFLASDMQTGLWYFESIDLLLAEKEAAHRPLGVYPNPVQSAETLNIILGDVQGAVQVDITDMSGRLVQRQMAYGSLGTYQVVTSGLASGTYVFSVRQNGKIWTEKIAVH